MPIILILTFVIAFLILFSGGFLRSKFYNYIGIIPLALFIIFCAELTTIHWGSDIYIPFKWIPFLGIDLNLKLDGLSLLFALLITGIGTLVFIYASYYLKKHPYLNRFYGYMTLFMGAMLGVVLSDNLISLFVFWELTSISSFFLIGFNNEEEASRKSALNALGITALGGFFMLGGFILIYNITGTFSIRELIKLSDVIQQNALFPLVLVLIFLGAFTKSAQFPFHSWLPGAMKAPTPVSAYLHSATMVKAGIYLLARMTPVLSDGLWWNYTLMIVGGITMFYAAFHSVFRTDMKSILAYSTISALGIIVFLLGIGNEYAYYAAVTFILVHALYKAALFLTAGIVDHAVHTRDITQISGLKNVMPLVFYAALVAALSSAGVPLMFGFISKDLIYEATLHLPQWAMWITGIAVLTNIFLACAGFMVGIKPFMGKLPEKFQNIHKPDIKLWLPVVILSSLTLLFGLFPVLADNGVLEFAFNKINQASSNIHLKIWHGFNEVLLLSTITILLGFALFFIKRYEGKSLYFIEKFNKIAPQKIIDNLAEATRKFAFYYTRLFHNGYLRNYLITIILFLTLLVGYRLFTTTPIEVNTKDLSGFRFYELTIFVLILIAIFFTIMTKSRLTAIVSMGIVGYCICLIYVFYGAPDLAMTQFAIDTLTVVLFVLVLYKLPPFLGYKSVTVKIRDTIVSAAFGGLMMLIALQALVSPYTKETSKFYADNVYSLAKGKNVVNVILVDFRGFDTMIEGIVLSIAALGVYSLLKYKSTNAETE